MTPLDEAKIIQNIKLDLEITDNLQDELINMLLRRVIKHFKAEYGVSEIDDAYSFIFEDCVIKRFNRRGSEGAQSESVEGHSVSYYDNKNEFLPYDDMLQKAFGQSGQSRPGRVFIL
ncbi:phage head-tail connector protein [Streptococcus sp. ZY19097]|uniref:phage head-tail connector protein n=1 Tax=Streptococcus sp. ZY19097 TaxID=3231906 RepID=UPI0034585288